MSFSLMKTKKQAIDVWSVKSLETTHARKKYKAPDFGGPGQPFGEGHPLWWRMRNRWRHHLVPFQGESLGLDWVVIVVVVVLILTGIIRLVRVLFIECIKIVLFNQCLYEEKSEEVKKSETNESGLLVLLLYYEVPCVHAAPVFAAALWDQRQRREEKRPSYCVQPEYCLLAEGEDTASHAYGP